MAPPTGPTQQTSGTEFILVRMEYICGSDAPIHHRFKVKSVEPHLRPYEEKLQALKTIGDIEMGPAFYGLAGYILSVRWATEYEHIECRSFAVDRTSAFATKNPSWRDLFRIHNQSVASTRDGFSGSIVLHSVMEVGSMKITPALPHDVERLILEWVALTRLGNIPSLMLVAHRVRAWVEPLLYRELVIDDHVSQDPEYGEFHSGCSDERYFYFPTLSQPRIMDLIAHKGPSFFHGAVRTVRLHNPIIHTNVTTLFTAMSGITNLILDFNAEPEYLPVMAEMSQLRRLKTALKPLFGRDIERIPFGHPVFRRITHLYVCDHWAGIEFAQDQWESLGEAPALTHFALEKVPTGKHLMDILSVHPLQCIVFWLYTHELVTQCSDIRVVHIQHYAAWAWKQRYDGPRDGEPFRYDEWGIADFFITGKKEGTISRELSPPSTDVPGPA
ncbi:hypothetical protein C8R47DRAFT_1227014 [Mycena vitilis]|nr:hypothetical protein C8R47DRAFT_1227014 [Mycena vitilis]